MARKHFSDKFEHWLNANQEKNIGDLLKFFGTKSFGILFLVFMFIPSLPIPTGGITHFVLLPAVWIVSLQMIFGRKSFWLPKSILKRPLGSGFLKKALPFMINRIRTLEKISRPRNKAIFDNQVFKSFAGICMLLLAIGCFVSPPFSGLDTVPAMGAVVIALSIILEDSVLFILGVVVGAIGLGIIATAAQLIATFFKTLF